LLGLSALDATWLMILLSLPGDDGLVEVGVEMAGGESSLPKELVILGWLDGVESVRSITLSESPLAGWSDPCERTDIAQRERTSRRMDIGRRLLVGIRDRNSW